VRRLWPLKNEGAIGVSFSDTPETVAMELARLLDGYPSVTAATLVDETDAPSGHAELDVLVETTARNTVPNTVAHAIVRSSLGIAAVDPANNPDYKRVIVR